MWNWYPSISNLLFKTVGCFNIYYFRILHSETSARFAIDFPIKYFALLHSHWHYIHYSWYSQCVCPILAISGVRFPRTYWVLTYTRSWTLLEEPPNVQPLNNFPAFYGTRRFNTAFTRALHWSLSWAISIQSITPHHILILPSNLRLGLPSGRFSSGFLTNTLHAFLLNMLSII
jgi:hypothetical protein